MPGCRNGACWSPYAVPRCEQRFGESISGVGWSCTSYPGNIPDTGCTPVVGCSASGQGERSRRSQRKQRPFNDGESKKIISSEQVQKISLLEELLNKEKAFNKVLLDKIKVLSEQNIKLGTAFEEYKTTTENLIARKVEQSNRSQIHT